MDRNNAVVLDREVEPDRPLERPRLGRYEVLARIGEGAIGRVYRAFDPVTGREVAIKKLWPKPAILAQVGDCRRRFYHEAQVAGGLSHPNIVVVYDVAADYFVMEFLQGSTLRTLLDERGRLPLDEALPLLEGVADGLDYAHKNGIVHRDVKPSNIMILPDGRPKLMDFGAARYESLPVTAAGTLPASPLYLSPEQIEGGAAGSRVDLFAFAAVAYEVLTGRKAFDAPNVPAIASRILADEPEPPSQVAPELPERIDAALARGLAKRAEDRWPSAAEMVAALRGPQAPRVRRRVIPVPAPRLAQAETQDLRLASSPPARTSPLAVPLYVPRLRPLSGLLLLAVPLLATSWSALAPARATAPPRLPLSVFSEPPDAIVWIDGKPAGRTPLRVSHLRPGTHRVKVHRTGFVPAELQLPLREGDDEPLVFHLQAATAPPAPTAVAAGAAATHPREGEMVGIGADVTPPRRIAYRSPSYPWHAYPAEGLVRLEVTVTENGEPTDIRVLKTPSPALAEAFAQAVATWRFDPARKHGVRVKVRWPVEMKFTIRRS